MKIVERMVGASWFVPVLPWVLMGIFAAIAALGLWVSSLKADTLICEASLAKQSTLHAQHLLDDAQATADNLRDRDRVESALRLEIANIRSESQEFRDESAERIAALDAAVRDGQRRVRPEICNGPRAASAPSAGAASPSSGTPGGGPAQNGAGGIGRVVGAAAACDADFQELYKQAVADRKALER